MRKKLLILPILALFLAFSIYSVKVPQATAHGYPSSALVKNEDKQDGVTRIYYTDEYGQLAFASNLRYAEIIRLYNEDNKMIREEFYDEYGEPAEQSSGYVATSRTYYPNGKLETLTYLDKDGKPFKTTSGYARYRRTYEENRETDWYLLADMNPAKATAGYYAYRKTYDEAKNIVLMEYLDKEGKPMNNNNGIARQVRSFSQDKHLTSEFYFDKEGNPAPGILGQYGLSHAYNEEGKIIKTTYLDAQGNPLPTNRGYAIIRKIYREDGIVTDFYYDANDNPMALSRGQFASRTINGQIQYLDAQGNVIFDLHNYLNCNPQSVVILGVLILCAATILGRLSNVFFLLGYLLFIAYMTLFYREAGDSRLNLTLFWSYRQYFASPALRLEVMNNIWLFVPFGFILARIDQKPYAVILCFLSSAAIEITQYALGIGLCELDDIFGNTLGGSIGFLACVLLMPQANPRQSKKSQ